MTPAPVKPLIPFSVLEQIDIRVGTITAVDDVAQSKKLARLKVDFGDHTRTILAGIKQERADITELLGKVSEGMLFDLGYADQILPALAMPERPVPNGTRAG